MRRARLVKRSSKPPCFRRDFSRHMAPNYLIDKLFWLQASPRGDFHPDSPRVTGQIAGLAGEISSLLPRLGRRTHAAGRAVYPYRCGSNGSGRAGVGADGAVARHRCLLSATAGARAFAKAVPDLTIVLNHLGGVTRIGPYADRDEEVLDAWRSGIAALAPCRNVNLKVLVWLLDERLVDGHTADAPTAPAGASR